MAEHVLMQAVPPLFGTFGDAISIDTKVFNLDSKDFDKIWDDIKAGMITKELYYVQSE